MTDVSEYPLWCPRCEHARIVPILAVGIRQRPRSKAYDGIAACPSCGVSVTVELGARGARRICGLQLAALSAALETVGEPVAVLEAEMA